MFILSFLFKNMLQFASLRKQVLNSKKQSGKLWREECFVWLELLEGEPQWGPQEY